MGFSEWKLGGKVSFGGGLGGGILNSGYLNTGGLIYPNLDGSGPQADSLAAAIYGVAIPPGFNQFSASENFFGRSNQHYPATYGEVKPSDLLIGTGKNLRKEEIKILLTLSFISYSFRQEFI